MTTLEKLTPVFRMVFDDDSIILNPATTANDIDGWDSLTHMNLISAVELAFKVRFALGELQKLKNVGMLVELVDRKLAK